jgi:hypothetical protein
LPQGSFLKVSDASNHLIGIGNTRDGSVMAPQSGANFDIVQKVVTAYRSGGASAAAPNPASTGNDPGTGSTAAVPLAAGAPAPVAERIVTFTETGDAIITDPKLGKVRIKADGTEFDYPKDPRNPDAGEINVVYKGSKNGPSSGGKKFGEAAGSTIVAAFDRRRHIQTDPDKWEFQAPVGGSHTEREPFFVTGQTKDAANAAYKKLVVIANSVRITARELLEDEQAAVTAAAKTNDDELKKGAAGKSVRFAPLEFPTTKMKEFATAQ